MSRKLTREEVALKATDREHLVLNFPEDYRSVDSKIKLRCLICEYDWETTVRSCLNSNNGCKSCKAETTSRTHKGKEAGKREDLECHHLDGWNLFPDKRYDPSNGVCLHKSIHKRFHNANSYGNNTELQFAALLFNIWQLDWQRIKIELQQGNRQPSSPKSSSLEPHEFERDVGEKVQRLEGEELNQ